jgi:hypothetical protein
MLNYRCKHCHTPYIIGTPKSGEWTVLRCKQCGGELELENKARTKLEYEYNTYENSWFYSCSDFTSGNYVTISF